MERKGVVSEGEVGEDLAGPCGAGGQGAPYSVGGLQVMLEGTREGLLASPLSPSELDSSTCYLGI